MTMQTTETLKTARLLAVLLCCGLESAQAQTITNADVPDNLNLGTSWVGGMPAGSANVAVWDSTVVNNPSKILGGNLSWGGVQILNPAGPINIGTNASGNILTLGASGIDMSAATTSLNLTNAMALSANQTWNVTNGLTLTVSGQLLSSTATTLTLTGGGTNNFSSNLNGTYAGNVSLNGGTLIIGGANGNTSSAIGTGIITNNGGVTLLNANKIVGNVLQFNGTNIVDANLGTFTLDGAWQGSGTVILTNMSGSTVTAGGNGNAVPGGAAGMANFTGTVIVCSVNRDGSTATGNLRFNNGGGNNNLGNAAMTLDLGQGSAHFTEKNNGATTSFGALFGGPNTQLAQQENYVIGGLNLANDTFSGTSTGGTSTFTKNGTGQFTWNNTSANTYTGTTTVNAGILQIGDGTTAVAGTLGPGGIVLAGGSLVYNKPDAFAITNKISGIGGTLIKTNSNVMTYYGTNTASGATLISQGTLALATNLTGAAAMTCPIFVASGATFDVSQDSFFSLSSTLSGFGAVNGVLTAAGGSINPGASGVAGTLTFNAGLTESGSVNNQLVLSTPGSTNDLISVAGPLTLTGTNNFTLSSFGGGTISNGIYPLIAYSGALSGDVTNFTVIAFGATGTLTNITTATPPEIAVIISPAPRGALNLTWMGGGANNWDTTASNWVNGAISFAFQTGDSVLFNDSAFPNTNVAVAVTVLPASVTVSNTHQYFLAGNGNINGATGLTKTNSGTLSISTTNGYTGPTIVGGGTLEVFNVADGGSASAIGAAASVSSNLVFQGGTTFKYSGSTAATDRGATLNGAGATVDVPNGVNLTLNGTLTGPGALTKYGSGTLTIGGSSSYTGGTVISNGILATANQAANVSGFGTNAITFHGGTLTLYSSTTDDGSTVFTFSNPLIVPAGQTGNLAVFERGVLGSTLTGGGTINVSASGQRGGFGGDWSAFTGIINVITNGNTTSFFRIDNALGYSNAVFNLNDGADLDGGGSGGPYSSVVTFDIGELDGTSLATISSPAMSKPTLYPTWRVGWKNTSSTFAGTIGNPSGGVGSLTKVGTGTLTLLGQNSYTGPTIVSNGVLALSFNPTNSSDSTINNSATITIAAGAVLDVSGRNDGRLQLISPQILQGNGTISGVLDATGSGTISPGGGITGSIGTLTVTGNIYFGPGTDWMKLNRAGSPNSDRLVSSTGQFFHFGEDLIVTNIGAPLQAGDTFTLFSGLTSSFNQYNSITLPGYYIWDTSRLAVNGSITVTSVLPRPSVTKADFSGLAGGAITLSATNGIPSTPVNVLSSTNLALPLGSWTVVTNTTFNSNGNLVDPNSGIAPFTFLVNPAESPRFYLLQTQ